MNKARFLILAAVLLLIVAFPFGVLAEAATTPTTPASSVCPNAASCPNAEICQNGGVCDGTCVQTGICPNIQHQAYYAANGNCPMNAGAPRNGAGNCNPSAPRGNAGAGGCGMGGGCRR